MVIGDFFVIFCDFLGWDCGTPLILWQNPNKITVLKSWDWVRPPPPPPCWDKIPTFTENLLWMLPLKAEEKNWLDLKKKWTRSRRRISCDPQPRPFLNWKGSSGFDSQTSYIAMDRVHICQRQRFLLWQGCNRSDCEPFLSPGSRAVVVAEEFSEPTRFNVAFLKLGQKIILLFYKKEFAASLFLFHADVSLLFQICSYSAMSPFLSNSTHPFLQNL